MSWFTFTFGLTPLLLNVAHARNSFYHDDENQDLKGLKCTYIVAKKALFYRIGYASLKDRISGHKYNVAEINALLQQGSEK